ncbi:hypothetical protein LJR230_005013 [Trinickia sp. LjRoot230]|uniref:hypothetical protein n=1 Tax=Trinickia sp. LjRoot230 TaxID=3342288 RepID=UPI003ED00D10
MGVGMQIVYLGFAGTSQIEAEAASLLVRLERFGRTIAGCHLAIEFIHAELGATSFESMAVDRRRAMFDARLDLITRSGELVPIRHCQDVDAKAAIQAAFDLAEAQLEQNSTPPRS